MGGFVLVLVCSGYGKCSYDYHCYHCYHSCQSSIIVVLVVVVINFIVLKNSRIETKSELLLVYCTYAQSIKLTVWYSCPYVGYCFMVVVIMGII